MLSWSRALRACHQDSATTATPEDVSTQAFTPGMERAFSSLKVLTEPPSVGGCASAAYSMLGSFTSMPKMALPSTFDGVSLRFCAWPMMVNSPGDFRGTSLGTGSFAAASATSPNFSFL
jgi:hypothetical protein